VFLVVRVLDLVVVVGMRDGVVGRETDGRLGLVWFDAWFLAGKRFGNGLVDDLRFDGLDLMSIFVFLPRCRLRLHAERLRTGGLPVV